MHNQVFFLRKLRLTIFAAMMAILVGGCSASSVPVSSSARIIEVTPDRTDVPRYEMLELDVALNADYQSPYDMRQVRVDAVFTGPDGKDWNIPGFWDGKERWLVRFTPSLAGEWHYEVRVTDASGVSRPVKGTFAATASDWHGWLQVASWVNPSYSKRYLAYHDGTPFYGVGHCDAFSLLSDGFDAEKGLALFDQMNRYGENIVVFWPIYSNPFFNSSFDRYSAPDLQIIDMILKDAEEKGIFIVFTVWDHPQLRGQEHPWGPGQWDSNNGFRKLGTVQEFFTEQEMWAWQENLYRYMIARWGHSPAIGMWLTVSEIEGTNVGSQKDAWHKKVNDFFASNDAYRHPTTASMAGDQWWPEGFAVMDVLQMHSYNSGNDPVGNGKMIGEWTSAMWQDQEKPNFIGEFGSSDERNYPELAHNALWSALANGAAVTPMEWNDRGSWAKMSDAMLEDIARLAKFVSDLPLAHLNPTLIQPISSDPQVSASGIGRQDMAVVWLQDVSQAGWKIDDVRGNVKARINVTVKIAGLEPGRYLTRLYDPWTGEYVSETYQQLDGAELRVTVPEFKRDIAIRLEKADE